MLTLPTSAGAALAVVMVAFEVMSAVLSTVRCVQALRETGGIRSERNVSSFMYIILEQGADSPNYSPQQLDSEDERGRYHVLCDCGRIHYHVGRAQLCECYWYSEKSLLTKFEQTADVNMLLLPAQTTLTMAVSRTVLSSKGCRMPFIFRQCPNPILHRPVRLTTLHHHAV